MLRWRMFLTFLAIVLSIMGGVHWYLFVRLVAETQIPAPWSGWVGGALVVVVLCIPLSFIASRALDKNLARFFVVPIYVWLGFAFQTFFLLLAIDLVRALGWIGGSLFQESFWFSDPGQALLAWRVVGGAVVGITLLATVFAIWWCLSKLVVK
ncbi:MAG: hypothetical protein HKO65_03795, partial [Gemmatimonadetes bacterium]|nr:hypothetical protein [Gemmatimonadota bacterium]NNM04202.1 hypothetical protein [Gemmatimonadota bacterium]